MRKIHVRLILDVYAVADDDADVMDAVANAFNEVDMTGECGAGCGGSVNIQSVEAVDGEITDSR